MSFAAAMQSQMIPSAPCQRDLKGCMYEKKVNNVNLNAKANVNQSNKKCKINLIVWYNWCRFLSDKKWSGSCVGRYDRLHGVINVCFHLQVTLIFPVCSFNTICKCPTWVTGNYFDLKWSKVLIFIYVIILDWTRVSIIKRKRFMIGSKYT